MSLLRNHAAALAAFTAVTIVYTYPLSLSPATLTADGGVDQYLTSWILAWDAHAIATDPLRIFDANIFYPHENTLAFSENLISTAALVLPAAWLGGSAMLVQNLAVLLSFVLAAYAAYLLAHELVRSRAAALVAGFIFGFYPYRLYHLSHVQLLMSHWIPLAFLCLLVFMRTQHIRYAFLAFLCVPLQALGSAYYGVFLSFSLAVFACWMIVVTPDRGRMLARLVGAAVVPGLLVAIVYLPYSRAAHDHGATRSVDEVRAYSADAVNYLAAPRGHWLHAVTARFGAEERYLYTGAVALALAIAGVASRSRSMNVFAVIGLVALLFTFGPRVTFAGHTIAPTPYYWIHRFWPGADGIRATPRWSVLFFLFVAVAAAGGFAWISRRSRVAAILATALLLADYKAWPIPTALPEPVCTTAYARIAELPGADPIVEVPAKDWYDELIYQYGSSLHLKPLVRGASAFVPKEYPGTFSALSTFPGAPAMDLLNSLLPTPLVLVHLERMTEEQVEATRTQIGKTLVIVERPDADHMLLRPRSEPLAAGLEGWHWRGRNLVGRLELKFSGPTPRLRVEADGPLTMAGDAMELAGVRSLDVRLIGDGLFHDRLKVSMNQRAVLTIGTHTHTPRAGLWCALLTPQQDVVMLERPGGRGALRTVRQLAELVASKPDARILVFGGSPIDNETWTEPLIELLRRYGAEARAEAGLWPDGWSYLMVSDLRSRRPVFERMAQGEIAYDSLPDSLRLTGFRFTPHPGPSSSPETARSP